MTSIHLDTRRLRYFIRIAELGSLTRAAEYLHIAQPALSQHLAALETDFGVQLLIRSHQGTTLTEAGRELYRHAQLILREVEQAQLAVRASGQAITGRVSIGVTPGIAASPLPIAILNAATARYPGITVSIAEFMSGTLRDLLGNGRLDMAMLYGTGPSKSIAYAPLLVETLRFVLPQRLAGGFQTEGPVDLNRIGQFDLILPSPEHELRKTIEQTFVRSGLIPRCRYEIDSLQVARSALKEGLGAALLTSGAWSNIATESNCVDFAIQPEIVSVSSLCVAESLPLSEAAQLIHAMICDVTKDIIVTGKWSGAKLYSKAA